MFGVILIGIGLILIVFFSVWTQVVLNHAKTVSVAISGLNSVAGMAVATAKGVSQGLSNAAAAVSAAGKSPSEDKDSTTPSVAASLLSVLRK